MQNEITQAPSGNNTTETFTSASSTAPVLPAVPAAPAQQQLARSAVQKRRAKALLDQLSGPQRRQVFEMLYSQPVADVLNFITAPPPEGLGIKTHYTTIHRLKNHVRSDRISYNLKNLTEVCHDIVEDNPALDLPKVQSALSAMLHDRLFQLLEKSNDTTQINKLIDAISKFSALEFKRQSLARDQHQSHTARHHRVDLNIVSPPRPQPANAINISTDPTAALPQIPNPPSGQPDLPDSQPV